mmetsp:Transcript_9532/g.20622  ORF Transcript_9532/g.20622 Transcript_9532/m.20622 type:complete len:90 (-) Transcript_9532:20-289(-)
MDECHSNCYTNNNTEHRTQLCLRKLWSDDHAQLLLQSCQETNVHGIRVCLAARLLAHILLLDKSTSRHLNRHRLGLIKAVTSDLEFCTH